MMMMIILIMMMMLLKVTGCDLKVLGLTVFSYCSFVQKLLKQQIEKASREALPFTNPEILREIEYLIKHRSVNCLTIKYSRYVN